MDSLADFVIKFKDRFENDPVLREYIPRPMALYRDGGKVHLLREQTPVNGVAFAPTYTVCGRNLWDSDLRNPSPVVRATLYDWRLDRPCGNCLAIIEGRVGKRTEDDQTTMDPE